MGADEENHIRVGKLNLVDLAGSERQAKTGATVSPGSLLSKFLISKSLLWLLSCS